MDIETKVVNLPEVYKEIDSIPGRAKREIKDILNNGASFSEQQMKIYAPGSIRLLADREPARSTSLYAMEATAGIKPGTRQGSDRNYPLFVHKGTGIYNLDNPRLIRSNRPGGVLAFEKKGEGVKFRQWVRGQKPNPFVYFAYQATKVFMGLRLKQFNLNRK